MTFVSGETWDYAADNNQTAPQDYTVTYAREFRYDERSERERPATGRAGRDARVRAATCPKGVSRMRTSEGVAVRVT